MTTEQKASAKILEAYNADQKELRESEFKRDCRRTSLQLASRNGKLTVDDILEDADKMYLWLISAGNQKMEFSYYKRHGIIRE